MQKAEHMLRDFALSVMSETSARYALDSTTEDPHQDKNSPILVVVDGCRKAAAI